MASMTMAARIAYGRLTNKPVSVNAASTASPARTSPASCVRAPALLFAADWLAPPPTMNPRTSPYRMFEPPMAISSRFASMS